MRTKSAACGHRQVAQLKSPIAQLANAAMHHRGSLRTRRSAARPVRSRTVGLRAKLGLKPTMTGKLGGRPDDATSLKRAWGGVSMAQDG